MLPRDEPEIRATGRAEDLSDAVGRFVVSFVRVIRTLQLYPPDHRFVREGFEELVEHLATSLGVRDRVTIGFREDAVLFDDEVCLRGNPTVESLKHYLNEKNIESFTIDRDVQLFELRSLADLLAKHRHDVMRDGHLDSRFLRGVNSIRLNEVSYRRVGKDEGSGDGTAEPVRRDTPDPVPTNPFLALSDPRHHAKLSRRIAEDPAALASSFGEHLSRTLPGFSSPTARIDDAFLEIVEQVCMAVLSESGVDLTIMRRRLESLLRPLDDDLINRGLRGLVRDEMRGDVGRVFPRFSVPSRARMLLTEAYLHPDEVEGVSRAFKALAPTPDQGRDVLGEARDHLNRSGLTGHKEESVRGVLDRLDRGRVETSPDRGLVVLAEKDPQSAGVARLLLERAGFDVLVCADGTAALESVQSARPALLVMDPVLPGIHGLEILVRLKRMRPPVPVILMSPHDGFRDDFAVSTYPEIRCVRKPLERDRFDAAIDGLISGRERPTGPLGPDAVFEEAPDLGPTFGMLRTSILEVGVCARGRFRDVFFRVLPIDDHRAGVFVAEREAGPIESKGVFRRLGTAFERSEANPGRPTDWLRRADRTLRATDTSGILMSGLGLVVDDRSDILDIARAGFNSPVVATPDGAPAELLLPFGPLLGASHAGDTGAKLQGTALPFPPGASILLFSSAAIEAVARDDTEMATRMFTGFLRQHAGSPIPTAMEALMGLLGGLGVRGPGSDLQMLLVRRR